MSIRKMPPVAEVLRLLQSVTELTIAKWALNRESQHKLLVAGRD
jgi:hypothetical protein